MIKAKNIDMTQGSVVKSLSLFAIPIILSDFFQQLYSTVDSIIVGKLVGTEALAAVGETFPITNIFLGTFLGISLGCTVTISNFFGAKNQSGLNDSVDTTLKLTGICCVIFTIAGSAGVPFLLRLAGTADDVYADAKIYLGIYMAGISTQLIYNMFSAMLKAIGDSGRPLYVLIFTSVLNIGLDILFVGPMNMGVAGAAYATIISQAVSAVILWLMLRTVPVFELPLIRKQPMSKEVIRNVLKVGIPFSIQRAVVAFSNTIVVSYINRFGSTVMAGWSIYQKVDQFVISSIVSLGSGVTTFVAQNVGANKPERIRKGVSSGVILTILVSALYTLVLCPLRYNIASLFSNDSEVIEYSSKFLLTLTTVHVFNSIPQVYAGALRGRGKSIDSTVILISCYCLIRQIYLFIRWPYFQSPMIVVAAMHFTWVICGIWMFLHYRRLVKLTGY